MSTLVAILDETIVFSSNYNGGYNRTLYLLYWMRQQNTLVAIMESTTEYISSYDGGDNGAC